MFLLHSRERELHRYVFGRDVRTRLGVAIFEVFGPPVFHIKMGTSYQMHCPRTQQANLSACSPQPPLSAERQARKLWMPFLKSFGMNREGKRTPGLTIAKQTL